MSELSWMVLPIAACVVVVLTLGWFGLHVLQRGVIFVDLALAQVAALGTTYAVFLGHEPESGTAFILSLVFTFIGAAAFSAARLFEDRVPQEAIIGIAYAVSAATGILLVHFANDPHGGEKLEHLLVGNIVWVQPGELALLAGVCGAVGVVHFLFRTRFLEISYHPEKAVREGRRVAWWDLLFYVTFGFALTAIVSVTGVLLVFSYLVIPAVVARLLAEGVVRRLLFAWGVGLVVSVTGVALTYRHPTGPAIVGLFGVVLIVTLVAYAVRSAARPGMAFAQSVAAFASVGLLPWGFGRVPTGESHDHQEQAKTPVESTDPLASADPVVREAAARDTAGRPERREALAKALAVEADDSLRLTISVALVRTGDRRGVDGLVSLTQSETPFIRMEADSRLRTLAGAGAPTWNPAEGPDTAGSWSGWLSTVPALPEAASTLELPP